MLYRISWLISLSLLSVIALLMWPIAALSQLIRRVTSSPVNQPQEPLQDLESDEDEELDVLSPEDTIEAMRAIHDSGLFEDVIINFFEDCLDLPSPEPEHDPSNK